MATQNSKLLKQARQLNHEIAAARSVPGLRQDHDALVAQRRRVVTRWFQSLRP